MAAAWLRRRRPAAAVLALVLLLGAAIVPAQAAEEPDTTNPRAAAASGKKAGPAYLHDQSGRSLYFVHFQDAPLARYSGGVKNLAATSLAASGGRPEYAAF